MGDIEVFELLFREFMDLYKDVFGIEDVIGLIEEQLFFVVFLIWRQDLIDEQIIYDEMIEVLIKGVLGKCRILIFLFIRLQIVNVVGYVQFYGIYILVVFSDKYMFLYVYYIFFYNFFFIVYYL